MPPLLLEVVDVDILTRSMVGEIPWRHADPVVWRGLDGALRHARKAHSGSVVVGKHCHLVWR